VNDSNRKWTLITANIRKERRVRLAAPYAYFLPEFQASFAMFYLITHRI
jgi:hypothetical protein